MDAAPLDLVAALWALGDGRFEWEGGRAVELPSDTREGNELGGFLSALLALYAEERTSGRVLGGRYLHRLDADTVRAPDVAFFRRAGLGRIKPTHSEGGADLVIEVVSPDSRERDRGRKFYEYERAGVEEHWIVDPERWRAEFYRLREGAYEPVLTDADGKLHSSTLPGFFIRVEWLWNRPKVLDALRELGVL